MTKAEAVKKLDEKLYSETDLDNDINYFTKKMGISRKSFEKIMKKDPVDHLFYPNNLKLYKKFKSIVSFAKKTSTLRR